MDDPYNDVWLPALVIELALPDGGALLLLDNNALLVRNGVDGGGDNGVALGAVLGPALLLDLGVVDGLDNSLVNGGARVRCGIPSCAGSPEPWCTVAR